MRRENVWTLDELCATFDRFGFPHERLSAAEANARYPQYHLDADAGEEAVFQAAAGILRATPAVRATWEAAKGLGAVAVEGQRMKAIRTADGEGSVLEITTGTEAYIESNEYIRSTNLRNDRNLTPAPNSNTSHTHTNKQTHTHTHTQHRSRPRLPGAQRRAGNGRLDHQGARARVPPPRDHGRKCGVL